MYPAPPLGVVTATEAGHQVLALLVNVHPTGRALEALVQEAVQQGSAVVTEGWTRVRVGLELVLAPLVIKLKRSLVYDRG